MPGRFQSVRARLPAQPALAGAVLLLLVVSLPLATSLHEVAMAVALVLALLLPSRFRFLDVPWGRAALAVACVWALIPPAPGGLREGLGHAWLLAPIVAIPALLPPSAPAAEPVRERLRTAGLWAAGAAACWGLAQRLLGHPATGPFSHHLTLAYALVPAFGVALAGRRWVLGGLLAGGVLSSGSSGATIALCVTAAAVGTARPIWLTGMGLGMTLVLLPFADTSELVQRAVLWTGGLTVGEAGPVGPGGYAAAASLAYENLAPGFWFPNHAHDSTIQVLAVLGPAGGVAVALLCGSALSRAALGPAAGVAGVLVGGLTQDVLGELEVARAMWMWVALGGVAAHVPPNGLGRLGSLRAGRSVRLLGIGDGRPSDGRQMSGGADQ